MGKYSWRLRAAVMGWSASFVLLAVSTLMPDGVLATDLGRWSLWVQMLAFVPTSWLIIERVALRKTERYEQILRDVIRMSAEELVHARARAEEQRRPKRKLRSV